jgi:hypothetical protein
MIPKQNFFNGRIIARRSPRLARQRLLPDVPGTSGKIPFQARQSKISVWTGAKVAFKRFPLAITPYLAFCM